MKKLAVVGSRKFDNYAILEEKLNNFFKNGYFDEIVSGGAKGADSLAEKYSIEHNIPTKIFHAQWEKYGRAAGMIRNKDIIKNSDLVIAFWDGKSKGTKNSIDLAKKNGKECVIILEEEWT